jgi:ubiquinol-cytochrome c reductase cytochrome b subunit
LATVITSLATVIPVVGKQIVYWLWGGLKKAALHVNLIINIIINLDLKILLDAGTSQLFLEKKQVLDYVLNSGTFKFSPGLGNQVQRAFSNSQVWAEAHTCGQALGLTRRAALGTPGGVLGAKKRNLVWRKPARLNWLLPIKSWVLGFQKNVKTFKTQAQSAGLLKGPQRLNAEDLMWLVGFVEGDGCFCVTKNGVYVKYEFSIEVSIQDIQLLYKIKTLLGAGSITTRLRGNKQDLIGFCQLNPAGFLHRENLIEMAHFKISGKSDLVNIVLPIFDRYCMLTAKQYDYLYFKKCLLTPLVFHKDLPFYVRPTEPIFESVEALLKVPHFDNWLVGFIEAEASFSCFQSASETNETAAFSLSQTDAAQVMEAIRVRLKLKSKVNQVPTVSLAFKNLNKNVLTGKVSYVINTASVHGVNNVIVFLTRAGAKLKGNKRAQYLRWLHAVRPNPRYASINIPYSY